jgi:hypothetical protein
MANKHKGELLFTSDDKSYTMSFTINALIDLDDALGVEDAVGTLMSSGKATVKQYRTMFFTALRHHHPEIKDEKEAANLVTLGQMMKLLTEAIVLANPPDEAAPKASAPEAETKRHPQNGGGAERGTGPAS